MLDLFPSREASPFGRRLKRERGARIPVTVVTGFLGAGKTTLIRRFLKSPEGQGTAVIVNEFGAVGIDDALVRDSAEETVLLGNGCLCCITRTDLQVALRRLIFDRERGTVPPFARILIETSGLADPAPILQTFSTDRALGGEFHIDVVLAVVDAINGETSLDDAAEARKQVILADRLIISKTDLATPAAVERLTQRLQELNPRATIDIAVAGALDPSRLIQPVPRERSNFVAEAEHGDGIASFVLATGRADRMADIFARHGDAHRAARDRICCASRACSTSPAAAARSWCNMYSTSRIHRSSSTRGPTKTARAGWSSSRAICANAKCATCSPRYRRWRKNKPRPLASAEGEGVVIGALHAAAGRPDRRPARAPCCRSPRRSRHAGRGAVLPSA